MSVQTRIPKELHQELIQAQADHVKKHGKRLPLYKFIKVVNAYKGR